MNSKSMGLGQINHGELVYYYPIKIETALSYDELCEHVVTSIERSFSMCKSRAIDMIVGEATQDFLNQRSEKATDDLDVPGCAFCDTTATIDELPNNNLEFKLELHLGCMKAYRIRDSRFEKEYDEHKKIYGASFLSDQKRILLPPLYVELYNGKRVWLNVILALFANKMGVLKLELPLIDVSTHPLKKCDVDAYIASVVGGCVISEETIGNSFCRICELYIGKLLSLGNIIRVYTGMPLRNIILVDCEGLPDQLKDISVLVQKDLYEIISAPVDKYIYCEEAAIQYIKTHSWGRSSMRSVLNINGGVLTLLARSLVEQKKEEYAKTLKTSSLGEEETNYVYQAMIESACINTEFALIILALKKLNDEYIFQEKRVGSRKNYDIQKEYNKNTIFISTLQNSCMGTVYEQLQAFKQMMPYYVKEDLLQTRMAAIDRIQANEDFCLKERNQFLLTMAGVLLTALFGLPAIHDTLLFLREVFLPHGDIPHISIEGISVFCWGLMLFGIPFWWRKVLTPKK